MFNAFKNSDLAYYLYMAFVIILGIGSLVIFYFMVTGFNIGVYNPNTIVGNVYIGGLNEEEARQKVNSSVTEWFNDEEISYEIGYQGYYLEIDREIFEVDVNASFSNISEGTRNPLSIEISDDDLNVLEDELLNQQFMDGLENTFSFGSVIESVLNDARELKQFSRHQLNQHLVDESFNNQVINHVSVPGYLDTNISTIISNLEAENPDRVFELNSHEIFSVLEQMPQTISSDGLNTIGAGLLDLILPTEIEVHTLNYNMLLREVETNPFSGRSVLINRNQNIDFRIENITYIDYEIYFYETDDGDLGLELRGEPSLNSINLEREEIVLDYQPAPTGSTVTREGQDGMIILITRNVNDIYGENKSSSLKVFEYYEPLNPVYED